MKKITPLILAFILVLLLSACSMPQADNKNSSLTVTGDNNSTSDFSVSTTSNSQNEDSNINTGSGKNNTKPNESSKPQISSQFTTQISSKDNTTSAVSYKELICRQIPYDLWEKIQIENKQSKIKLQLELPNDWKFTKYNKTTLNITRAGKNIGIVTSDNLPASAEEFDTICNTVGNTEASMIIARYKENQKDVFYWDYVFATNINGKTYTTKMHINYTELDEHSANDILQNFEIIEPLKPVLDIFKTNGAKQILILGNSFIRTSEIGSFLNDMLSTTENDFSAIAISRGMAHVENYANDTEICSSIKNGNFCYVFICGFYSYESIDALYTLKSACNASNTQLVIFPAHNENTSVLQAVFEEHNDTSVLNWKNEINLLIENGVSYNDFCINDTHQHSKPLAGYVGAHMIYRSIFKNNPPLLSYNAPLTNDYIKTKLKDYVSNGEIPTNNIKIYEIN